MLFNAHDLRNRSSASAALASLLKNFDVFALDAVTSGDNIAAA